MIGQGASPGSIGAVSTTHHVKKTSRWHVFSTPKIVRPNQSSHHPTNTACNLRPNTQ
jgi:hypothetical protein